MSGEHVRASAAIPVLFPTVEITAPRSARGHYIDGGTRLNSPIKPALHLGADRVIVVGLEAFAHLHESVELGYWLRVDTTGRGLMTEAGRAVLDWAFGPVNAHRVRVAAATDNHLSLAVIRRLGFRFEGIARQAERCNGRWLDHAVFALLVTDPRGAG